MPKGLGHEVDGSLCRGDIGNEAVPRVVVKSVLPELKRRIDIPFLLVKLAQYEESDSPLVFCPLHDNTRTPAFHIRHEGRTFHCYGCGTKGDVITFTQELYEVKTGRKLPFNKAVSFLGHLGGIVVDNTPTALQQVAQIIRTESPKMTGEVMTEGVRRSLSDWAETYMAEPLKALRDSGAYQSRERWLGMWDAVDDMRQEVMGGRMVRPKAFQSEIMELKQLAGIFSEDGC